MDDTPAVSIALSMHNAARTIEQALRSLLAQSRTDWELILMDDGSSDDGLVRAQRYADARFRFVVDGQRRGLAARLNQAIELARGRYFARMDADDIAYPERLERQLAFLEAHPEVDLVGAGMMVFGEDGEPTGLYPVRTTHAEICSRPASGFYLAHPTWVGRIEWFRRWRYDPVCRKAQDQDLLLRAYASSRFAALPEALVGYRQETVSIRKSLVGRYYFSRGLFKLARRDGAWPQAVIGAGMQALKAGADAFAIATSLSRRLLRHRALPFSAQDATRWGEVWRGCQAYAR